VWRDVGGGRRLVCCLWLEKEIEWLRLVGALSGSVAVGGVMLFRGELLFVRFMMGVFVRMCVGWCIWCEFVLRLCMGVW